MPQALSNAALGRYSLAAAALIVALAASEAQAGIVFANAASPIGAGANNSQVTGGSTFDTATVAGTSGSLTNVDGTHGLQLDPSNGTETFFFRFGWSPGSSATVNGDISLRLFFGTVGSGITVTIQDIVYQDGTGGTGSFTGINHVITNGSGGVETIRLTTGGATLAGGFLTDFSVFTNTYFNLSITGGQVGNNSATDLFQIDAISTTPEPGTWALFGLGALGLAGLVRRRRRTRRTSDSARA